MRRAARAVKNGVSRQTVTAKTRRSVSPAARASRLCTSTQNAQPLICDARSRTRSSSPASIRDLRTASSSAFNARLAAGTSFSTAIRTGGTTVSSDRALIDMAATLCGAWISGKVQFHVGFLDQ